MSSVGLMNIFLDLVLPLVLLLIGGSILANFRRSVEFVTKLGRPVTESAIGKWIPSAPRFRVAFFALLLTGAGAYGLIKVVSAYLSGY